MRRIIVTEGACSGCNIMKEFKPRVVAVIPCYNTSSHIAEVVTKARQYAAEVIVVDTGSIYTRHLNRG